MKNKIMIGKMTRWGKVVAVSYKGERYYWMLKNGVISMMPAGIVEKK